MRKTKAQHTGFFFFSQQWLIIRKIIDAHLLDTALSQAVLSISEESVWKHSLLTKNLILKLFSHLSYCLGKTCINHPLKTSFILINNSGFTKW